MKMLTSCLICTVLVVGVLHPVASASETVESDTVIVEEMPSEAYAALDQAVTEQKAPERAESEQVASEQALPEQSASEQPMSGQAERAVTGQTDADLLTPEEGTHMGDSTGAMQTAEWLVGNGTQLDASQTEEWVFGGPDSWEQDFLGTESDPSGNPAQLAETESLENLPSPFMTIVDMPATVSDTGVSDNRNKQDYYISSSPVYSYLIAEGENYLRVESCDGQVLIERYNQGFLLQSQMTLGYELPRFGGFYAGSNAYYLVFGQGSFGESDAAEVVRVVKYDKNWARLGSASLFGANVTPFSLYEGSLRMAESGDYLYIHTVYSDYQSGCIANLMMAVRTSDMSVTGVNDVGIASLNQFILADDAGNLV